MGENCKLKNVSEHLQNSPSNSNWPKALLLFPALLLFSRCTHTQHLLSRWPLFNRSISLSLRVPQCKIVPWIPKPSKVVCNSPNKAASVSVNVKECNLYDDDSDTPANEPRACLRTNAIVVQTEWYRAEPFGYFPKSLIPMLLSFWVFKNVENFRGLF